LDRLCSLSKYLIQVLNNDISGLPRTNNDTVKVPTSSETWKCSIMGGIMPDGAELANVLWNIERELQMGT